MLHHMTQSEKTLYYTSFYIVAVIAKCEISLHSLYKSNYVVLNELS